MESLGIEIKKDSWRVVHLKSSFAGAKLLKSFSLEAASVKEGVEGLGRHISGKTVKNAAVAIVLPREMAFARPLEIPAPKAENISGILRFEVEKHLPFNPDDYHWGHAATGRTGNIHTVLLSAAKKKYVDALLAEFKVAGLSPACLSSPQAALLDALHDIKALRAGKSAALVSVGPETVSIDTFSGTGLVYSKAFRRDGRFSERFSREVRLAADAHGRVDGKGIDECFVCFEGAVEGDIVALLSGLAQTGGVKLWPSGPPGAQASPFATGGALLASGKGPASPFLSFNGGSDKTGSYAATATAAFVAALFVAVAGGSYIARDLVEIMNLKSSISTMKGDSRKAQGTIDAYNKLSSTRELLERIDGRAFPGVLNPLSEVARVLPEKTRLTVFETSGGSVRMEGMTESASALMLLIEEKSEMLEKVELSGQVVKTGGNTESFALNLRVRGAFDGPDEGGGR